MTCRGHMKPCQLMSLRAKAKQSGLIQSAGFFALRLRMTLTVPVGPTKHQFDTSHFRQSPCVTPAFEPESIQSLRHDSGVNNNCWRGKFQRRVLSERSKFTRLDAEPCRLLVNGCVLAGFAALLPPKVPK